MPSLFPGIDPYLESLDWFPDLHDSLITFVKGTLQQRLPEFYYAQSSQRVWLEYSQRYVEPDLEVVRSGQEARRRGSGGIAVAEPLPAEPLVVSVETIEHGPFEASFVEIRRRKGKDVRLVASIEILSLSNKSPGNPGREKYLSKQRKIVRASPTWSKSTCFAAAFTRRLSRKVAVAKAGPFDYHVSIHRFERPKDFFVYPITSRIDCPSFRFRSFRGILTPPWTSQPFLTGLRFGPYLKEVAYGEDPIIPPLTAEQAEWAAVRLKQRL